MPTIPPRHLFFDAHNDSIILREVLGDALDFTDENPRYDVDLPRLRAFGVGAMLVMVGDNDMLQSLRLVDAVHLMCDRHPQHFGLCRDAGDVRRCLAAGRIGLMLSIEGQAMFGGRLENLRNWHRLGVRVASLTHGAGTFLGHPHALQYNASVSGYLSPETRVSCRRRSKGLTPFGREALDEMARLGMVCDLAHANDNAFWETIEHGRVRVCITHGNCYALCRHMRNNTDEMLEAVAARGGVLGITFCRPFISEESPSISRLADHVLHALEVMGEDHVGIGSDFDGVAATTTLMIEDAAGMAALWGELARRGVSEATLRKVAMDNFLRLLDGV